MARPIKKGLDYFPMDVNLDDSIELLEAEHGLIGFAILVKLWQKIYSNGYFIYWNNDNSLLFSKRINTEITTINSVINACLLREIFNKDLFDKYKILTSSGIQKRFVLASSQSKRKSIIIIKEFNLINSELMSLITEFTALIPEFSTQRIEEESKVKESKLNNNFDFDFCDIKYLPLLKNWIEYKKTKFNESLIQMQIESFYKQLIDLSKNNFLNAEKIINQSISASSKSIYELKQQQQQPIKSTSQKIDEAIANITLD